MAINILADVGSPVQFADIVGYDRPGVYFLWQADVIVYVGQSRNVQERLVQHAIEGKKRFDGVSFRPCSLRDLNKIERYFIETLLPKYNRCSFSDSIRAIWAQNPAVRPLPDRQVGPATAASILGITIPQLQQLNRRGLPHVRKRVPRRGGRRVRYSTAILESFAAQNADVIALVVSEFHD